MMYLKAFFMLYSMFYVLTLNVLAYKFDETVLENAQLKLIEIFHKKATEIRKEFPINLKEKNLLILSKEDLNLQEYDAIKFFQWTNQNFVVAAKANETSIYLVSLSDEISLSHTFSSKHSSFMEKIDIFKVIVKNDVLWIFETLYAGNTVKITKINGKPFGLDRPLTQLIFESYKIHDIFPFVVNETLELIVIAKDNLRSGITIYSEDDDLFTKKYEYSNENNLLIKPLFASSGLYFSFIGKENTTLMFYDKKLSNLQEIIKIEKSLNDVLIYEDELVMSEFIVLIEDFKIEIYLLKNKLFYWHRIFTEKKNYKGHTFSYEYRNFIAFAEEENISVYSQNGEGEFDLQWKFATCADVKETYTVIVDEGINIVIQCDKMIHLKRLVVEDEKNEQMQSDSSEDKIDKCLNEIEQVIEKNSLQIPELFQNSEKNFLQIDLNSIKSVQSNNDIQNLLNQNSKLGSLISSVDYLSRTMDEIMNKTKNIEDEMQNLLTYKGNQHIRAPVNVDKMLANYSIILSIDLEKLNGITLDEYKSKFMTLDKDQFVDTNTVFDKIITKNLHLKSFSTNESNIIAANLFDVKKPNQIVYGYHSFSSIEVKDSISGGNLGIAPEINGISVKTLVTKDSDVQFEGYQTISQPIKSEEKLSIKYLNGVDFGVWSRSVLKASRDPKLPFGGSMIVDGNVTVHGNIKATSINGIDFMDLFDKAAKRSNPVQFIKDKVVFRNKISVENLQISDTINDLKWDALLRKSDQKIEANFNIDEGLVMTDLNSESINGLNLKKDVLLFDSDQTLEGRITFVSDVEVTSANGVTMEMGATINAVDPSLHTKMGVSFNHKRFNKTLNLGEVLTINGNIRVSELNGRQFPDFKNNYWSKSMQQRIPHTVTIRKANFRKSFYSPNLNGINVKDYLLSNAPQTVIGRNFFLSDVLIHGNIYMENNRTIDNVDISALHENAMNLHDHQKIHSLNEFNNGIDVKKLLTKGPLKEINVDDLVSSPFHLKNNVTFMESVEAQSLHVVDLQAHTINNLEPFNSIIKEKLPVSKIEGNLFVKKIKVDELSFTKNLNGKDFNAWYKNVVRKSKTMQDMLGTLTVLGDVIFKGSIDIDVLNSRQLESFLKKVVVDCDRCTVHGKKVFLKPIEVLENLSADFINNVSLSELKERLLSRSQEQTIKGKYKFNGGLTASTVEVDEISGIPINEIILDNNINVPYAMTFENYVIFDGVYSKEGWMDGCKVSEVLSPTITQAKDLVFSNVTLGHLELKDTVILKGKVFVRSINKDFFSFLSSIVSKSSEQNISGSTSFQSRASVQSLKTDFINKYSYEDFENKINKTQTIVKTNCNIRLGNLYANEIISEEISSEEVNGLPMKKVSDFGIRKNYRGSIKGQKLFLNVFVRGNMKTSKINGINLEDLVKINGQNDDLKLVFKEVLYFRKDLNVHGKIADEDIDSLFRHFKKSNSSNPSLFPLEYDILIVEGDLHVDTVNQVNLSDVLLKSNKLPVITGKKNFIGGIVIEGDSIIEVLNGHELNKFKEWPYSVAEMKPERYSYTNYRTNSHIQKELLLSYEAFTVARLNEYNFEILKGLHEKLFSVTEEDRIYPPGNQIRTIRGGDSKNYNVFVQHNACLNWNLCPCFETYFVQIINNSKLLMDEDAVKGINIPVVLENEDKLFSFIIRCYPEEISTTMIEVHQTKEISEPVLLTEIKNFGLVLDILHFYSKGKTYLVLVSLKERNWVSLKTMNMNFETIWEEEFVADVSEVQIEMIQAQCYLLVVNKEPTINIHDSYKGTRLYLWNIFKENFVLVSNFPPSVSGDLINFDDNTYLVLGLSGRTENRNYKKLGSDLRVYRSSGKSLLTPFTSLSVSGISSSVFFTVGNDLYLAVASVTENSVSVYRMINQEGFVIQESLYVANPSDMHYINIHYQHYLLLSEYKSSIVLLKLNFKGVNVH